MNHLVLSVQLLERGALRSTPAGLDALDVVLGHASQVSEAGQPRKVSLELRGVAIGPIVQTLGRQPIGSSFDASGFLSAQRNGRGIVFHVTQMQ
jgi:primosomal replication protein N